MRSKNEKESLIGFNFRWKKWKKNQQIQITYEISNKTIKFEVTAKTITLLNSNYVRYNENLQ